MPQAPATVILCIAEPSDYLGLALVFLPKEPRCRNIENRETPLRGSERGRGPGPAPLTPVMKLAEFVVEEEIFVWKGL